MANIIHMCITDNCIQKMITNQEIKEKTTDLKMDWKVVGGIVFYNPCHHYIIYTEAVSSGMVEKIGVPRESHKSL